MQNAEKTSTVEIYALDGRKLFSENFSEIKLSLALLVNLITETLFLPNLK